MEEVISSDVVNKVDAKASALDKYCRTGSRTHLASSPPSAPRA